MERDLAHLRNILSEHSGPLDEDGLCLSDLLEVCLDGPPAKRRLQRKPYSVALPSVSLSKATQTNSFADRVLEGLHRDLGAHAWPPISMLPSAQGCRSEAQA